MLRPPREEDFGSRLHDERLAARLGLALGTATLVCFGTGLLSHLIQQPPGWFVWPTRPVWLYRLTQGVHITTGVAMVPLLLAKLWTVYPKLFTWPPVRSVLHAVERLSVLVLVAAVWFQVVTGVQNIASWYPWGFTFPPAHYAMAWVALGAVLVHVGVKLPVTRRALGVPLDGEPAGGPSRRVVLYAALAAAGIAALSVVGQNLQWLRRVSVLAGRSGDGPQGLPVTKDAVSAGVLRSARDPSWRLVVSGPAGRRELALADLEALPQHTETLPIVCVQGWAESATWTGPRVRDVAALAGWDGSADLAFESLQRRGLYRASLLPALHARDEKSLLALRLRGEPLDLHHGYPCRLITASRPGVLQTKWLREMRVLA